jgi:hypothetical protein
MPRMLTNVNITAMLTFVITAYRAIGTISVVISRISRPFSSIK